MIMGIYPVLNAAQAFERHVHKAMNAEFFQFNTNLKDRYRFGLNLLIIDGFFHCQAILFARNTVAGTCTDNLNSVVFLLTI